LTVKALEQALAGLEVHQGDVTVALRHQRDLVDASHRGRGPAVLIADQAPHTSKGHRHRRQNDLLEHSVREV
jgi:hypothetical protein